MDRYICIHGHFYQPPRENPWLEAIESQDSAYPYHDWNERITAECYGANAAARILDGDGRIADIVNNYSKISFNFGPTLLAWLEAKEPDVYQAVLAADRASRERFSGHGSAVAQVYNHMILPLANARDRRTQIHWGLCDFEFRFGRAPEGMWLAETAVDLETLDLLAEQGMRFTILAPHQAAAFRRAGEDEWHDVRGGHIDPTRAYLQRLPSGRSIALFFYDGPISRGIAFEHVLERGEDFAGRLVGAFSDERDWPQLVNIATDGETYGHHHRHGEMALAYALRHIESNDLAKITNYGEYLASFPPQHEVQIVENTSWSCFHGVERWRSNCGCNSGGYPGWTQEWRRPLRDALDWLRDSVAPRYEQAARLYLRDPWAARDDYVDVVLDRSPDRRAAFLQRHALHELDDEAQMAVWKLLELQRHALLMYTSCGWFFDELTGLETVQVIDYAGRVVQLAQDLFQNGTEAGFLEKMAQAHSNIPQHGDGRTIYQRWVKPATVDLARVGAHYAVSSLFNAYGEHAKVYCYSVERSDYQLSQIGRMRLSIGRARVTSEVTQERADLAFAVLYFGGHNLSGGVRCDQGDESYDAMRREIGEAFERADIPGVVRSLDRHLEYTYPLESAFRDEQRKISEFILEPAVAEAEAAYQRLYAQNAATMRFMAGLNIGMPRAVSAAAEVALNSRLRQAFASEALDFAHIAALLDEARQAHVALDGVTLGYTLKQTVEGLARRLRAQPEDTRVAEALGNVLDLIRGLPFEVDLWKTQNIYFQMLQTVYPVFVARGQADEGARAWAERFAALGEGLRLRVTRAQEQLQAPDMRRHTVVGTLRVLRDVHSPQLNNTRDILVYLPPSYESQPERRYAVLYMHDGQNLFDEATSMAGEWRVDETLQALSWEGIEAIVVGIPSIGSGRCDECSPFPDPVKGGGQGDAYLAFIVDTVKPLVDEQFRTLLGEATTGILGASVGGLSSLYAFFKYPEVFGFAGAMSPELWLAGGAIFAYLESKPYARGKIYLDADGGEGTRGARKVRDLLVQKGYRPGEDLMYLEDAQSPHHELAWARRLPDALRFLIPHGG